jgi:predicted RNase H-like nuclease (RuvC/YqgF family)
MENEQEQNIGIEELEGTDSPGQADETLARELESSQAAIAELEQALAARDAEVAVLNQSLEEARKAVDELGKSLPEAVAAYKGLVVQANPGVPVEMIAGDSIAAINESLGSARTLVERVRREIEAEAARTRIPAGAPQRTPPDMSALSAREKIQYALGGTQS